MPRNFGPFAFLLLFNFFLLSDLFWFLGYHPFPVACHFMRHSQIIIRWRHVRAHVCVGWVHLEIIPGPVVRLANHGIRLVEYNRRLPIHDRWPVDDHRSLVIDYRRSVKEYRWPVEDNIRSVINFWRWMVDYWRTLYGDVLFGTFDVLCFLMFYGCFLRVFSVE